MTDAPTTPREPVLVQDLLEEAVAGHPDATAVTDSTGSWTYSELAEHARAFTGWLRERGAGPGDRVCVRLGNVREMVAMLFGTLRNGSVFVPLGPALMPFHLTAVLADCEPALTVAAGDDVPLLSALTDRVFDLTDVWSALDASGQPAASWTVRDEGTVTGDDLALLMYTSGSTAAPKGVMCPHRSVVFAVRAIAERLAYQPTDVVLTAIPLSFDYGLYQVFLAALAGAEVVLSQPEAHTRLMGLLSGHRVTVVPVVPSLAEMLVRLADRGRHEEAPPVRLFTNTGAALAGPLIERLRAAFPKARVAPMYGITECKRVTVLEPDGDLDHPGSVGRALTGTEVLVLGEDGAPLPPGDTGQIAVRGPHLMAGYWRAPELTAARYHRSPVTGDVTLLTGDYGRLDAEGHLYFEGRRDDLFKRHGVRTSVSEIEAAALDIEGVSEVAVLPPEGTRDLTLLAVTTLTPEQVLGELGRRLEQVKVPAVCHIRDGLPLTPNGKTDRKRLREELQAAGTEPGGDTREERTP
ncbi:class I adenylate-forming enzyme family protein [Streptomyces sp. PTD9-10]|uniref:class I adenylate-forming enzyme family protein n=1 Tax=Streptomyces sp. PTD9-10 TaxID=3120151 RepID=UPI00300A7642